MGDDVEEVRGARAVVRFDGKKCIHARNCVLSRPDVFVPNVVGPWIHPDAATPEELLELAHACPSGAIAIERLDGGAGEAAPRVNLIRVRERGPLAIHADATIGGAPALRATLCRCGQSQRKPYCDGSHAAAGFDATGEPPTRESQPLPRRDGPVEITPMKDGPLRVQGPVEVVSGTGRTIDRLGKTALCRCGRSQQKPFCDGSHRAAGFQADGAEKT